MINTNTNSRYIKGGSVDETGFWSRSIFVKSPDDLNITISKKYARKPELLAYDLYGSAGLMWFVLQYNDIINPYLEFVEGKAITLPTPIRFNAGML
jgi:hypothetical protein